MLFHWGSIFFYPMKGPLSFSKSERLHGKKAVETLFSSESKWLVYPFRLVIHQEETKELPEEWKPKVLISVSKRNFKNAHDRNKIKRRIREAYRTQKTEFITSVLSRLSKSSAKELHIGFIYIGKTIESYSLVSEKMKKALKEILSKV
jgi:ribonuclease P protein component